MLITSDQQHWDTIGAFNPQVKTPNLDKLVKKGTLFSRAYCPNPTCTPTRASIITGMYPSQHGAYSLGTKLMENVPTIGSTLQNSNIDCSLIGKAHFQQLISTDEYPSEESYPKLKDLEYWKQYNQDFYGFNHVELARNHADETHVGQHYAIWMEDNGLKDWQKHFQNTWQDYQFGDKVNHPQEHSWSLPDEFHYNKWIADRSIARISDCKEAGKNFFLWSSFFDPHPPYLIPEPWASMYDPNDIKVPEITHGEHDKNPPHFSMTQEEKPDFSSYQEEGGNGMHGMQCHLHDREKMAKNIAIYYGMISAMDKYIGDILDKVEAEGMTEETLIVFTSDHGHFFGQHGLMAKGPFHYEDVIKVPFIVSCPGTVDEEKVSDALQSLVDLAPTFLDFLEIQKPTSMTGISQKQVWSGNKDSARDHVIIENRHQPTTIHLKTYIDQRYKLTTYYNQNYGELFDLEKDPGEINNLWEDKNSKDLKAQLIQKLLFAEMGNEPMPMPRVSPA